MPMLIRRCDSTRPTTPTVAGARFARVLSPLTTLMLLMLGSTPALAADIGDVHGVVHDAEHLPIANASVELDAAASAWSQTTRTDAHGEFDFPGVPLGRYVLTVRRRRFETESVALTVLAGAAPPTHVQLTPGSALRTIRVQAAAPPNAESFTPSTLVERAMIRSTPGADRSNSLAMITDYVPGAYLVHDQLHVRGGHQVTWEIDGVEIPNTNIASNLGPQIDPRDIDTLQIQRGGYGAAEGDRTYGVFNVVPRTGFERDSRADLTVSAGNFGQTQDSIRIGSHTDRFAYYASLAGNRSDLGLMTPGAQVLHDAERGFGGFVTLLDNVSANDQLRLVVSARRDDYQIPNLRAQIAADVQREADSFAILSWVRRMSGHAVLTSSLFEHVNRADYDGAPDDYPISTTDRRTSSYVGGEESLHWDAGRNSLDAGLYGFTQRDRQTFDVRFNDASHPGIAQALNPTGALQAAWIQDTVRTTRWLTLSAGLRQTAFTGPAPEHALDPRLGGTIRLPRFGWVLRGFWGTFYQPPPLETLSGPLLAYATSSALAFLPLHGERDQEAQVGLTIPWAGWTIDLDHFRTASRNFFDHNPIAASNVFLPITIACALIRGNELTVRSPLLGGRVRAYLTYSNQTADGYGAITGGLTDYSAPNGSYALDHDQRNTLDTGFRARLPRHFALSANLYVGSGFANGNGPPSHLPGHATVDLALAKRFGKAWSASLTLLNATDEHLLIDNSLTFGGTHWNAPREVYAQIRYRFAY